MDLAYLDNAATSHPKPESVYRALDGFMRDIGASPGRSCHRLAIAAGQCVLDARERIAALFNVRDAARVVFTASCTEAINTALKGLLHPGDRVVTTSMEHNAVMRPLHTLARDRGIVLDVVPCSPRGVLDPADIRRHLASRTRALVLSHASNVTGSIQPVAEAAAIARSCGAVVIVDAAQSAGMLPVDVTGWGIGLLAFSGHKGLLGPQGIGGLVVGEGIELDTLIEGGTGSMSTNESQPTMLPDKFESGTANGPGIAGLGAGVAHVTSQGIDAVRATLATLTATILEELAATPGVTVHGPADPTRQTAVISFALAGWDVAEASRILDQHHGILTRAGVHCAPRAHATIGSLRTGGTVRVSPGLFTTVDSIRHLGHCLREMAAHPPTHDA